MTNPLPTRPWAGARLAAAHNYWLASTRPDGRPHLVPIWGVWIDERFWFASFAGVKVDNVAAQPTVMLSTETPGEVVILDGTCARVAEADLPASYAKVFDEKYGPGWSGVGDAAAIHLRVVPAQIRAWHESEASSPPARFRFAAAEEASELDRRRTLGTDLLGRLWATADLDPLEADALAAEAVRNTRRSPG